MKKLTKTVLAIALLVGLFSKNESFANNKDGVVQGSNNVLSKSDLLANDSKVLSIRETVDVVLSLNVKKHRDSSLYKLILVNDKILNKYESMNYRLNKAWKYNSEPSK